MKRALLWVLGGLLALVAIVLVAASLQPAEYHIERSTEIAASPDRVYAVVSDLRRYGEWSPWEKLDPAMKKQIEGGPGVIGSTYAWDGNDDVGAGKMTILQALPNQRIDIKLEFKRPFESNATTSWIIADTGGKSKVTWAMDGRHENLIGKVFGMTGAMESMLGKDFDTGLAQLKAVAEKP